MINYQLPVTSRSEGNEYHRKCTRFEWNNTRLGLARHRSAGGSWRFGYGSALHLTEAPCAPRSHDRWFTARADAGFAASWTLRNP